MNKKITSIVLAVALVLTMIAIAVPAVLAENGTLVHAYPDKTEVKPGDTVEYTLTLGPCEHIAGTQITLSIPDGLEYITGAAVDGIAATLGAVSADYNSASLTFASFGIGDYSSETETPLAKFTCKVSDSAADGATYEIGCEELVLSDPDDEELDCTFYTTSSKITVKAESSTEAPTDEPTEAPTDEPTEAPTDEPTDAPTDEPTDAPTDEPTEAPTDEPTEAPTDEPTEAPTDEPTEAPTDAPTDTPDSTPDQPTEAPTDEPTEAPADEPTEAPTESGESTSDEQSTIDESTPDEEPTDADGDSSTDDSAVKADGNAVKTGSSVVLALILLVTSAAGVCVLSYYRKKREQ